MRLTAHADERRRERDIGLDEIEETMRAPERARQSASDETCYIFTKHVEDKRIKVVFAFKGGCDTIVVSVGDGPRRVGEQRALTVSDAVLACAALSTRGAHATGAIQGSTVGR